MITFLIVAASVVGVCSYLFIAYIASRFLAIGRYPKFSDYLFGALWPIWITMALPYLLFNSFIRNR